MSLALDRVPLAGPLDAVAEDGSASDVDVFTDPDASGLRAVWEALEARSDASPYQSFAWISCWCATVGVQARIEPRIAVVRQSGRPVCILPMAIRRRGPVRLLTFLGDSHTNFHMGLFDRTWLSNTPASAQRALLERAIEAAGPADVLELCCQPRQWAGQPNPFGLLPSFPSVNSGYAGTLAPSIDALLAGRDGKKLRKKRRWQANRLKEHRWSVTQTREPATLDACLVALDERFGAAGIWNRFADAGVDGHFHRLLADPASGFRLYALTIDGALVCGVGILVQGRQASGCFIARPASDWEPISPGQLLLHDVVERLCAEGITSFDLGKGREDYKRAWCDTEIAMFDTCIALTPWAGVFPLYERLKVFTKRMVRNDARMWNAAKRVRAALYGRL